MITYKLQVYTGNNTCKKCGEPLFLCQVHWNVASTWVTCECGKKESVNNEDVTTLTFGPSLLRCSDGYNRLEGKEEFISNMDEVYNKTVKDLETCKKLIFETLGEVAALFMSQGNTMAKDIVMPSEELIMIGERLLIDLTAHFPDAGYD